MGLWTYINLFIAANILLCVAMALLIGVDLLSALLRQSLSYQQRLRLGQAVILAALLLPIASLMFGYRPALKPAVQVWSAHSMHSQRLPSANGAFSGVIAISPGPSMSFDRAALAAAFLFFFGVLYIVLRVAGDWVATLRILAGAYHVRRRGRLHILASDRIQVPFSFWLPSRSVVVVPHAVLSHWDDLRLVLYHETQHHRQLDTILLYFHAVLAAVFFWNPAMHWLSSRLRALQEFACDEALRHQGRVSCQRYCECLLRIGETAVSANQSLLAPGMTGRAADALLRQRIEALLRPSARPLSTAILMGACVTAFSLMAGSALAFSTTIRDRRISTHAAIRMARTAQKTSGLPIVLNEQVLRQLNLLLATPDGNLYLQSGMRRMDDRMTQLSMELAQRHLPYELMAVPLVESGYRNLRQGPDPHHGAGLWMVIEPTANRLGLRVDAEHDDRLDERAETDAALQLFERLHRQFNDWGLALLGYNAGGARIENAVRDTGSRNVWTLINRGYENDSDYLARVTAAILVIKNPDVLN